MEYLEYCTRVVNERKDININIRISKVEKELLQELAQKKYLSESELIRLLIQEKYFENKLNRVK